MQDSLSAHLLVAISIAAAGCSQPAAPVPASATSGTGAAGLASVFPDRDPDLRWTTEDAFPGLTFQNPVTAAEVPGRPGLWLVGEREGRIWLVDATGQAPTRKLALDLSGQTLGWQDSGLLNLVFHPGFAGDPSRRFFYIFYNFTTSPHPGPNMPEIDRRNWIHLSRFTLSEALAIDPGSELVLIKQEKPSIWHNGGGLAFGQDGFLYVALGDEGAQFRESGDSFIFAMDGSLSAQRLSTDLLSGVLRIDVDQRGGAISAPIRKQPRAGKTQGYYVPRDNPWVGRPGGLEEFYAIGLRSPHRVSLDPATGEIWIGDAGHQHFEEVNILVKGGNYGWNFREGLVTLRPRPEPLIGTEVEPIHHYHPPVGPAAVIGGFVYRGQAFRDELEGRYIFGDNGTAQVFALTRAPGAPASVQQLFRLPFHQQGYAGLASFAQDHAGELYLVLLGHNEKGDGTVRRLVRRAGMPEARIPRTLSTTGLFRAGARIEPAAGLLEYWLNVPFWSDGTRKRRFLALPAGAKIQARRTGAWQVPAGTVVVKHFDLPVDDQDPARTRRLETRVLVSGKEGQLYGRTYLWNDAQDDAEVVESETIRTYTIRRGAVEPLIPATVDLDSRQLALTAAAENGGSLDTALARGNAAATRFDGDFDVRLRVSGEGGLAVASDGGAKGERGLVLVHHGSGHVRMTHGAGELATSGEREWVRVRRQGDMLVAFVGSDGVTWTELASRPMAAGPAILAAYTAGSGARLHDLSALREQRYYFPSPSDCLVCHNEVAGGLLGIKSIQLHRTVPGTDINQITAWQQQGILGGEDIDLAGTPRLAPPSDTSASLEHRVRSYLDTNCSFCHRRGGVVQVDMNLPFEIPLEQQGLIGQGSRLRLSVPALEIIVPRDRWRSYLLARISVRDAGGMPPLGSLTPDREAIALITEWIESLPGLPVLEPVQVSPPGGRFAGQVEVTLTHRDPEAKIRYTVDDSIPTEASPIYTRPLRLTRPTALRVRAFRDGHKSSVPDYMHFEVVPRTQ